MIEWTADADALLIKLWADGLSLALIADGLKAAGYAVSRNAVSGRRHRISRSAFVERQATLVRKARPRSREVGMPFKKPTDVEIGALKNARGVDYFDNVSGCKATLDRRGDWGLPRVCGKPLMDDNRVYCQTHQRLFHQPNSSARRTTDGQASQSPGSRNFRQGRA